MSQAAPPPPPPHHLAVPLCSGADPLLHISAAARVLSPFELAAAAAADHDGALRAAVAAHLAAAGECGGCRYAVLPRPAALCEPPAELQSWVNPSWRCGGCAVPPGGYALLLTAANWRDSGVEVGEWAGGDSGPAVVRLDPESECWGREWCAVTMAIYDRKDRESVSFASIVLLSGW
jgi:hypothetical protein